MGTTTKAPYDVLVLVGDLSLRRSLTERLGQLGHAIDCRTSVLAALDRVREKMPDLVVLDLDVDEGGGMPFLQILRRSQVTRFLPVLIVADKTRSKAMQEAYDLGASGPLTAEACKDMEGWIFVAMSRYFRRSEAIA